MVRGLLRHSPALDIVRIQDVGLSGAEDSQVLDWAAAFERLFRRFIPTGVGNGKSKSFSAIHLAVHPHGRGER